MSRDAQRRDRARSLRRELTPAERVLWAQVRDRQLGGFKFRRQCPIGPFFGDFACVECRLVVELDGESHLESIKADASRSAWMERTGWVVIRFQNPEVFDEPETVLEAIYSKCMQQQAELGKRR